MKFVIQYAHSIFLRPPSLLRNQGIISAECRIRSGELCRAHSARLFEAGEAAAVEAERVTTDAVAVDGYAATVLAAHIL